MTDLLSIGSSAVKNSQLALTVVSNNIANVNTEGYVKQSLIYEENTPASLGRFSIGSGATADDQQQDPQPGSPASQLPLAGHHSAMFPQRRSPVDRTSQASTPGSLDSRLSLV